MKYFRKAFTPPRGTVPVRIALETTYLTTPLTKNGKCVDYVLALEQHFAPQGSPHENGFRDLMQGLGKIVFDPCDTTQWNYCCKKLDLDPKLRPRLRFEPPGDDWPDQVLEKPWSEDDFPKIQKWIDENELLYQLFETVASKPTYYSLYRKRNGKGATDIIFPLDFFGRSIARCFVVRSNRRLAHDRNTTEHDAAWNDAFGIFRLARLLQSQPYMISQLIGFAVEGIANAQTLRVLKYAEFNVAQLRRCVEDLAALPEPMSFENIVLSERFYVLESLNQMSRHGLTVYDDAASFPLLFDEMLEEDKAVAKLLKNVAFDWNIVYKTCNELFDKIVPKESMELTEMNIFAVPEEELRLSVRDYRKLNIAQRSKLLARRLLDCGMGNVSAFLPVSRQSQTATDLTRIAFLLEIRRQEKWDFPEQLETLLEEKYLTQPPIDTLNRSETAWCQYRREGSGYLLYSVGMSGRDHGGNRDTLDDPPSEECDIWRDDICVRMK